MKEGRDEFFLQYFYNALHNPTEMPILYTASAQRLLNGSPFAAEVLSLREAQPSVLS